MLSESQLSFFKTYGYVTMKNVFTPAELRTLDVEFNHKLDAQYAHKPFDGKSRHWSMLMEDDTPLFASLLEDPRFLGPRNRCTETPCWGSWSTATATWATRAGIRIRRPSCNTA